ncbi:uncharacterized protein LOC131694257 [Topomyia yanbarensis]|uniref:uncharacterized protein LOC131694257 n=1 Tax=Topomyia yanbarensis TaxID=2498891 RepID=UPI00273A8ABF|nr:uncharacterized protein LOC131694257 [Topomyia yanbarensis]
MAPKKVSKFQDKIDPPPDASCRKCNSPDNSRMVQCDDCNEWYHYSCVMVDEGIADYDWSCDECVTKKAQPTGTSTPVSSNEQELAVTIVDESSVVDPKPNIAKVGNNAIIPSTGDTELTSSLAEKEENLNLRKEIKELRLMFEMQRTEFVRHIGLLEEQKNASINEQLYKCKEQWSKREHQLEKEIALLKRQSLPASVPKANGGTKSDSPSKRTAKDRERRLIALKERQALEKKHLEEQLELMEEPSSESDLAGEEEEDNNSKQKVHEWLKTQSPPGSSVVHSSNVCTDILSATFTKKTNSYRQTACHLPTLSKNQLAARQAVAKDLPIFSGDPEDWPLFFATFESSTAMCGYSHEENMFRLRRCLKDKAFDATRSLLLHPANVNTVISTLKTLFGRPNHIVGSMIQKIREIPPPEKLNTMINFGVSVQNLCATIQACELDEYNYNVTLLQELEEKLPPTIKLSWALTRKPLQKVNLTTFNEWLKTIVEAACEVTTPDMTLGCIGKTEKKKTHGFLNVHSECSSQNACESAIKDCVVCNGDCETVDNCKRFLAMSVDSRWKVLRACKLCRRCLKKHFTSCDVKDPCGHNGCSFLHHKLLHNEQAQGRSVPTIILFHRRKSLLQYSS